MAQAIAQARITTAAGPAGPPELQEPTAEPVRVLVVDRRPIVRAGLRRIAREACGGRALGVSDLARAATAARALRSELRALLLGMCGDEDPAARVEAAHRLAPTVIVVLEPGAFALAHAVAACGADGCLSLDAGTPAELRAALERAEAGDRRLPPELTGSDATQPTLTERALQVLQRLAGGLQDDEIARELGISVSAVRKQVAVAQQRLPARTRTEAVASAIRRGLL
jgi:DNA-binding NarL/FixJ family response regulator